MGKNNNIATIMSANAIIPAAKARGTRKTENIAVQGLHEDSLLETVHFSPQI